MLTLIIVLKALAEIAGLALAGQGVLYILSGSNREQNAFYRIIKVITWPIVRVTRLITPRFVADAHIPFVAFFLVLGLWIAFTVEKFAQCSAHPDHPACAALKRQPAPVNPGPPPGQLP